MPDSQIFRPQANKFLKELIGGAKVLFYPDIAKALKTVFNFSTQFDSAGLRA
jgi:hypothetical protein